MTCFSARKDDLLMWSHYAGGHNGICIEFRCRDKGHLDFFGNIHEVQYKDQLPLVDFYAPASFEKVRAFVLTKAIQWRDEQEWRMIVPFDKGRPRFIPLTPDIISTVYLGCKLSPENKAQVLARIASKAPLDHVELLQANRHPRCLRTDVLCTIVVEL